MTKKAATPWGAATKVDEIKVAQRVGEKRFAIPFEALKLDATREHFTLDVDKDKLKNAPGFDKNHPPQASDRTWGAEVYKFYGYKPYWQ